MQIVASIAQQAREVIAAQAWLGWAQPYVTSAPDWALLAAPTLIVLLLMWMVLRPRQKPQPKFKRRASRRREPSPAKPARRPARADRVAQSPAPTKTAPAAPPRASSATAPVTPSPAPQDDEDNRSVRVFVSSTFLDMQSERDILVKEVFPALRARMRARGVELLEVDLRWGITKEQSESGKTLPTLLAEIDRCRPYFIGLLGDRYGWVPPERALSEELKATYPAIADAAGRSVTELEIIHGVLRNPDSAARALFFERDLDWDWMATLSATERAGASIETAADQAKLADLKASIRARVARVEHYRSPDELGQAVLKALGESLDARFPEVDAPDAFEQTARLHRAYARERRGLHIGAGVYRVDLDQWMAKPDAPPLLITGESGGGKSTLVANWLQAWRAAHPGDIVFEHYLGASPDSADPMLLMRRLWEQLNRATGESVELPTGNVELMDLSSGLSQRLAQASAWAERKGAQILIALDGLDKLSSEQNLRWLPNIPRLKLVASSLDGEAKSAALSRGWTALEVKPLNDAERREFIERTLEGWGRKLLQQQVNAILGHAQAGNPLFLKTVLDELRVSATHARLEERLGVYLGARDIPDLFARVLARLEDDCEPGLVATTLPLIWASRAGLEEREIITIADATPLAWATLRNGLGDNLRDQAGRLAFSHDYLNQAVAARYLDTDERQRGAHLSIADRFEEREPDARQAEELPFQLRDAEAWERLEALLIDLSRFMLLRARGDGELWSYWLPLKEQGREPEALLCGAFEVRASEAKRWTKADIGLALSLCNFLGFAGAYGASRTRLQQQLAAASERLFGFDDPRTATGLANLADLLRATNRHGEAEPLYKRALAIAEASCGPDHPTVATILNNLALLLEAANRHAEAEPLYRRALAIHEKSFGPDHPNVAKNISNLAALYLATNRHAEAEPLFRRSLAIAEASFGLDHPDVARGLNNLALFLKTTNRHAAAEPLYQRALAIYEASFGPDHPNVATGLNNLASLLKDTNRHAEAEPLYRRALAIGEQSFGPTHPDVAIRLNNLAVLLCATNRHADAEPLLKRALAIMEGSFGPDHPNSKRFAKNLAICVAKIRKH